MIVSVAKFFRAGCLLLACAGCASDPVWQMLQPSRRSATDATATDGAEDVSLESQRGPSAPGGGKLEPPANATAESARTGAQPQAADPKALAAVLADLNRTGALDESAQQRLLDDLQHTDPALWPQLIGVFRASLAYRQKYNAGPQDLATDANQMVAAHRSTDVARAKQSATAFEPPATLSAEQRAAQPLPGVSEPVAGPVQLVSAQTPIATLAPAEVQPSAPAAAQVATPPVTNPPPAAPASATPASITPPVAEPQRLDWRGHLQATIDGLERETADPPATTAAVGRHAGLRMLYLLDGRRDAAVKPIAGIAPTQQDFWSKEMFGLATYLDAERHPDETRRAAAACVPLNEAQARLAELATLTVRNLAFCTEVTSYGVYKRFDKYDFQPGQEVLLYAEVENFKSLPTDKGYHTALKSSYQILDTHGARVDQKDFEITSEHCQNVRRDYFTRYFVWMPKRIYGGTYTLQLTIEDTLSQKIGQASIEFTISEKDKP